MGPLHTAAAVRDYEEGIAKIRKEGGQVQFAIIFYVHTHKTTYLFAQILVGGKALKERPGFYVEPTLVAIDEHAPILQEVNMIR